MIGNRAATAVYWLVAVVLSVFAGVAGSRWGNGMAPSFDNDDTGGTPATSASRLIYSIFGGALCAFGVLAVFAAVFMVLWLRARRSRVEVDPVEDNDETFIDDLEFGSSDEADDDDHALDEDDHEGHDLHEHDVAHDDGDSDLRR